MRHPATVSTTLVIAWAWSQALHVVILEPLYVLASLTWNVAVWPSLAPRISCILPRKSVEPVVEGCSGPAGAFGLLTRHQERIALLRAAGAAAHLPPDVAAVVFATHLGTLTVGSVMQGRAVALSVSPDVAASVRAAYSRAIFAGVSEPA